MCPSVRPNKPLFQHGKLSYHINGEVLYTDTSQFGSFVGDRKVGAGRGCILEGSGQEVYIGGERGRGAGQIGGKRAGGVYWRGVGRLLGPAY
jgi:hypothetical protein